MLMLYDVVIHKADRIWMGGANGEGRGREVKQGKGMGLTRSLGRSSCRLLLCYTFGGEPLLLV